MNFLLQHQNLTTSTTGLQGIPTPFCRSFLPQHDFLVLAEGENGKQYELKYLAHKTGLSAGWRTFAVSHKLHEGDVLIFQLVASCKFKVMLVFF